MAFTKTATVKDIPEGKGKQVSVKGKAIALFNIKGTFFATDAKCTHMGGLLAHGEVDVTNTCVKCPWHHAIFDLKTGEVKQGPAEKPVATYKTKVEGNDVFVDV